MNIAPNFELKATQKSKWHAGPNGCRYRFEFAGTMQVEWEGTRPPLKARAFWQRYARRRDAFLASILPAGQVALSICGFTQTAKAIEGKADR